MLYNAYIKGNKIKINTETGMITGSTYSIKERIKEDFYAKWNSEAKAWENKNLDAVIEKYKEYLERVWHLKAVESDGTAATDSKKADKKIVDRELVNGNDGFYEILTYSDGSTRKVFVG